MTLLKTLLRPDHEENQGDRSVVLKAANLLQIGEFQLLQLAYRKWHDADMPENEVHKIFHSYMIFDDVPHWARHYARDILRLEAQGRLNDEAAEYHRYDTEFNTRIPLGLRRFVVASVIIFGAILGSLIVADYAVNQRQNSRILPPYFDDRTAGPKSKTKTEGTAPDRSAFGKRKAPPGP